MSEAWAERERRTNQLVRIAANYVFEHPPVSPDQLYGLCRLTWITESYDDNHAGYVTSVKKPALGQIFGHSFSTTPLTKVAAITAELAETDAIVPLVKGFTHFYRPYRNTARQWIADNFDALLPLFQFAFTLANDDDGVQIADAIAKLPGIPKAGTTGSLMHPEFLLTPVFFALDSRVRFPIINGNRKVTALLKKLGAGKASLPQRYLRMVAQYGIGGIEDAADLDQVGEDLASFVLVPGRKPTRQLLARKPTDGAQELPLKDEADIQRLQQALRITARRLHNKLTNALREKLKRFTLYEGVNDALFDILVRQFDGANDLLIEAKSSVEIPDTRVAIGQLFDYWFREKGPCEPHVAVLFPAHPPDGTLRLLDWLKIGALWFDENRLVTSTEWLEHLQG
jgi:hypothetical protein